MINKTEGMIRVKNWLLKGSSGAWSESKNSSGVASAQSSCVIKLSGGSY